LLTLKKVQTEESIRKKKLRERRLPKEYLPGSNQINREAKRLQPLQASAPCRIRCSRIYF
jgi:hypothetical protein